MPFLSIEDLIFQLPIKKINFQSVDPVDKTLAPDEINSQEQPFTANEVIRVLKQMKGRKAIDLSLLCLLLFTTIIVPLLKID